MTLNDDGVKDLVTEIVFQAVKDYNNAQDKLAKEPNDPQATLMRNDTEKFFKSSWFETLTGFDGNKILNRLQQQDVVRKKHMQIQDSRRCDLV